ncbi:hypothetical protein G6F22_016956 [Rhizopus arrhizus]|nr:hypothetical protein G6F22_016956 [Rhizopus arrhizus]
MTTWDAILIGGGHNGLVCAAYLARAGKKVLVLERRGVLGGAAVTVPGDAVFSTTEIFWRPSDFLNSSTQVFELYGRLSNTLYDKGGKTSSQTVSDPCGGSIDVNETSNQGLAGIPTTVGSLGMRFTPSTERPDAAPSARIRRGCAARSIKTIRPPTTKRMRAAAAGWRM